MILCPAVERVEYSGAYDRRDAEDNERHFKKARTDNGIIEAQYHICYCEQRKDYANMGYQFSYHSLSPFSPIYSISGVLLLDVCVFSILPMKIISEDWPPSRLYATLHLRSAKSCDSSVIVQPSE